MIVDIENINTFEKRNKVYTTQWRTIYEVIKPEFLKKSDTFLDDFIKNVRIMQMKILIYQLKKKYQKENSNATSVICTSCQDNRKDFKFIVSNNN